MKAITIIGWREWVALPDLDVAGIKAKIDTGAKTSSLHAYRPRRVKRGGKPWVRFFLHPVQHHRKPEIECIAPLVDERVVRSSNGAEETRLTVRTTLKLGPHDFAVDLTLTNRDAMGFRMLIGRNALRKRFFVDSGGSFTLGEPGKSTRPRKRKKQ